MSQRDYLQALVELGERDAESQMERISAFVDEQGAAGVGALSRLPVDESSRVSMV